MKNLKIGYSPIGQKILAGKAKEIGRGKFKFTGEKQDVTDDVLVAVCLLLESKQQEFLMTSNGKDYLLSVEVKISQCEE